MPITDKQFREVTEMVKAAFESGKSYSGLSHKDQGRVGELYTHSFIKHDVRLIFGGNVYGDVTKPFYAKEG